MLSVGGGGGGRVGFNALVWQCCPFDCAWVVCGHDDAVVAVPPTFPNTTVSIYENATMNSPAGAPMNATSPALYVSFVYSIVGGTGASIFRIGGCDGQIRLAAAGVLNYYAGPQSYSLLIQVVPNGVASSAKNATITVKVRAPSRECYQSECWLVPCLRGERVVSVCVAQVLQSVEPPIVTDTAVRSVSEVFPANVAFGAPIQGSCGLQLRGAVCACVRVCL